MSEGKLKSKKNVDMPLEQIETCSPEIVEKISKKKRKEIDTTDEETSTSKKIKIDTTDEETSTSKKIKKNTNELVEADGTAKETKKAKKEIAHAVNWKTKMYEKKIERKEAKANPQPLPKVVIKSDDPKFADVHVVANVVDIAKHILNKHFPGIESILLKPTCAFATFGTDEALKAAIAKGDIKVQGVPVQICGRALDKMRGAEDTANAFVRMPTRFLLQTAASQVFKNVVLLQDYNLNALRVRFRTPADAFAAIKGGPQFSYGVSLTPKNMWHPLLWQSHLEEKRTKFFAKKKTA